MRNEIDPPCELHSKQVATQSDVVRVEAKVATEAARLEALIKTESANLARQMAESQRWTITAMFAAMGGLAMLQHFMR